ncbi:MAG: dihydropteroate synthase [Clostridia bacterium]|nr:dihydropteroate synthase [Clostridia bacterium]
MKGNARILVINNLKEAAEHITAIGAEEGKVNWLASKSDFLTIKFDNVHYTDAIIIKNDTLEMGGNAVYNKGIYDHSIKRSDVIIAGSRSTLERLSARLMIRKKNTREIADALDFLMRVEGMGRSSYLCRDKRIPIGNKTVIMGVLEITPDSDVGEVLARAESIVSEGADILDITCNQMPVTDIPASCPAGIIEKIRSKVDIPICTDVSLAEDAKAMLSSGADIINDIWALSKDPELANVVASYKAGIILMHHTTNGLNGDVIGKITSTLRQSIDVCQGAGIGINRIIADPGLGFGKTTAQNLQAIRKLREIKSLGVPLMVGPSGKNLYSGIVEGGVDESVESIASVVSAAIINGADIIRVHDVKQMKAAAMITDAIINK